MITTSGLCPRAFAVLRDPALYVERRYLRVEARVRAHRNAPGILFQQLLETAQFPLRDLPLLVVVSVLGDQPAAVGVQRFLFRSFELEVQHMQGVVHVGPYADMLGDMAFPTPVEARKQVSLSPQAPASVQGIEIRDIKSGTPAAGHWLFRPPPAGGSGGSAREGFGHVHKGVSFQGETSQPLGVLPSTFSASPCLLWL